MHSLSVSIPVVVEGDLKVDKIRRMSISNLPIIRSKIKERDMPNLRDLFAESLGIKCTISVAPRDYTFYIVPEAPNSILVSVEAIKASLSFSLNSFATKYLRASSLTPIQLTPNSWAYLLSFVKFASHVLGKETNMALFRSMFTASPTNRGNFDKTYALLGADREVKRNL